MLNNYGNFKCLSDFDKQREIDSPHRKSAAHASPHQGFEAGAAPDHPNSKNIHILKEALKIEWDRMPQEELRNSAMSFRKRMQWVVDKKGGYIE